MTFGPKLLTEQQARRLISPDALVVRAAHHWWEYPFVYGFATFALAFFTLPLWRSYWLAAPDLPNWVCYVFGGICVMMGKAFVTQLTAARQPSAWLLALTRDRVWIKFRSFHHWKAPAEDKVVFQLDRYDVDRLSPRESKIVTGSGENRKAQWLRRLDFRLREKLSPEQIDAVNFENRRMFGGKLISGRNHHMPVLIGEEGALLLVDMRGIMPSFKAVLAGVPSTYLVEQLQPLGGMEAESMSPYGGVSDARAAEISSLAQGGQKIEAIRLLRTLTGMGLKEAKDAIEAGRWKGT